MQTNQQIKQELLNLKTKKRAQGVKIVNSLTNHFHKLLKHLGKALQIPNFQRIITNNEHEKIILVNEDFKLEDLNEEDRAKVSLEESQIELNYKNYENQQLFDHFTSQHPQKEELGFIPFPNSFQTVGHMAHYNLTTNQQIFKHVVGEITLLKCPNIKTVVNKTEKLHNIYRTPTLQHMAGQRNYFVKLKEQGVIFQLDFEKVYWCSRLQQERDRLLAEMQPKQLLADIFCGVGPLAVRAAKKGLYVIANDLNPYCYQYLTLNCKLNKVESKAKCWNMCAREAMRKIYSQHEQYEKQFQYPDHIYMNLPVDAIEFLDVLADYGERMKTDKMPLVHVNCFVVADSDEKSKDLLSKRIDKVLPGFRQEDIVSMHHIKNVTVIMRMYCISIRLRSNHHQQHLKIQEPKVQEKEEQKLDILKKRVKQQ